MVISISGGVALKEPTIAEAEEGKWEASRSRAWKQGQEWSDQRSSEARLDEAQRRGGGIFSGQSILSRPGSRRMPIWAPFRQTRPFIPRGARSD